MTGETTPPSTTGEPTTPPTTSEPPAPSTPVAAVPHEPPRRRPSAVRLGLRFGEALALGFIGGFVLLALAPVLLGWRPYTVLTGSMRPNIDPGDVVMDRPMDVSDAKVGHVITFSDPSRNGALVTHRIRSITRGPVRTDVETRGDANNSSERWSIKTTDQVGRVVYVIPKVGHLANFIRNNPLAILFLVVLPVIGIGFGVVRWIWEDDDEDGDDEDGDDEDDGGDAGPDPAPRPTGEEQGADDRADR